METSDGGSKRGARNWFQGTQDCHTQLQNISEFKELVKKIQNHPHRAALHAALQMNNVCNPFSKNLKAMIRELSNVELVELCETTPKAPCSHCLLYWNQEIVYCTCGQCLTYSESRRHFWQTTIGCTLYHELLKKGATHGGSTRQDRGTKNTTWLGMCGRDAARKKTPKVNVLSWITARNRMDRTKVQRVGWTCTRRPYMSTHSRGKEKIPRTMVSYSEQSRQKIAYETSIWYSSFCLDEKIVYTRNQENPIEEPIRPEEQRRIRRGQDIFSEDYLSGARIDQHTGWQYWLSTSSSSWWHESEWSWKWAHIFFFARIPFCCSWFRLQLTAKDWAYVSNLCWSAMTTFGLLDDTRPHVFRKENFDTVEVRICILEVDQYEPTFDGKSVNRTTLTRVFSRTPHLRTCICMTQSAAARVFVKRAAHPQVITCLIVRCLSTHWSLPLFRVSLHLAQSLHLLYPDHPPCGRNRPSTRTPAHPQNEEYGFVAIQNPLKKSKLGCGDGKSTFSRGASWFWTDFMEPRGEVHKTSQRR